ncbi:MAG: MmcQ/YjbR family DNA-binding protein [Paracoccaceae bacterium]
MTRPEFDALCATMPGAVLSGPGELDAWKIGGKMFACFGHVDTREDNTGSAVVRVTDKDTAQMLIDAGAAHKPAYFRGAWVGLTLADLDPDEARHRIDQSYATIRGGLTKAAQAELPAIEAP